MHESVSATSAHERVEDAYRAATLYYLHHETMESVARQLKVSRSTVSRLLKQARESGVVRITLSEPRHTTTLQARRIEQLYGLRAHIVPVREGISELQRLEHVARTAAHLIGQAMTDNAKLGLAWGTTVSDVVRHLQPRDLSGVTVVQLNGAANSHTSGIPYAGSILQAAAAAFGGRAMQFPVPAFFDYAATKEAMWRERSIRSLLAVQSSVDIAVFGVGALSGPVPSHVYSAGYLGTKDMDQLRNDRVVGDVCTVFLREDGTWADIAMNGRATGLNPTELAKIPRRFCVVAGAAKVTATRGALRARVATDLVIDEATARALLEPNAVEATRTS